ncbi:MAG: NAD-dependent epimerase/dehydratase family protein [Methanobacterium sp.]
MKWHDKQVLVTGGASFIGSHLVDTLLSKGADVKVADNLSSGKISNLNYLLKKINSFKWIADNLVVFKNDLKDLNFTKSVMEDVEIVFHLAASHGGRGYIEKHPVDCCTNMALDQIVFEEAFKAEVDRICFASSACVYPSYLQETTGSDYLLKEKDANPFVRDKALADLEYGWAKLMGEMTLKAYNEQYGVKTSSTRIFTSYGPRENETHAIIALIAKALIKMDPYVIWGSGEQDRNFTYVEDTVNALIRACEKIKDGSPINAGRDDRITINETAELIFDLIDWRPENVKHDLSKPEGVSSRAADLSRSRKILGWEPKYAYKNGFQKTIDWYKGNKNLEEVKKNLNTILMEFNVKG